MRRDRSPSNQKKLSRPRSNSQQRSNRLSSKQLSQLYKQECKLLKRENEMYRQYFGEFNDRYQGKVKELELMKKENKQLRNRIKGYDEKNSERSREKSNEVKLKTVKSSSNFRNNQYYYGEDTEIGLTKHTNSNGNSFI